MATGQSPNIEILICTIDSGLTKIPRVLAPPEAGIAYLVSWQKSERFEKSDATVRASDFLKARKDVRIVEMNGRGLSANRNNAIRHAVGSILVMADDDCRYTHESLERLNRVWEENPQADVILCKVAGTDGSSIPKKYPTSPCLYQKRPRGYYASSWEITFRNNIEMPSFDRRFGLGAAFMQSGEDPLFVHEAHQKGLRVMLVPEVIGFTDPETTGRTLSASASALRGHGGMLAAVYGIAGGTARCLMFAFRQPGWRNKFRMARHLFEGMAYLLAHPRRPHEE